MEQDGTRLARIVPPPGADEGPVTRRLNSRQKAAVLVRFLMGEGVALPISDLPERTQTMLAAQMAHLRVVNRATLDEIVSEFEDLLGSVGLTFPGGIEGALSLMDGHISPAAASRLRREAGMMSMASGDPWERLGSFPAERLKEVIESEATELAAVALSKIPVSRAAEILALLPGDHARRIALAVSQTADIDPETVRLIGHAILTQIDSAPPRAFERIPEERVGAILDVTRAMRREEVLRGLDADDRDFAERVRRVIFAYEHIPARLREHDVPKAVRATDQAALVTALAYSATREELREASEYLLVNMPQRLAQVLREEVSGRAEVGERDGEAALAAVVEAVRGLESAGELVLRHPEEAPS